MLIAVPGLSIAIVAQSPAEDSLVQRLASASDAAEQVSILVQLYKTTEGSSSERSLTYARRAATLADTISAVSQRLEAYVAYGKALRKSGKAKESVDILLKALSIAENAADKTWQLVIHTQLGWGFFVQKDPALALAYFDKAEKAGRLQPDSSALARMYMDKGMVLQSIERISESYLCFDRAYQIYTNIGRHDVAAHMLAFLYPEHPGWLCFLDEQQLREARAMALKSGSDYFIVFSALQDAGCHAQAGNCAQATPAAEKAWESARVINDLVLLSMTADRLVELFRHCRNYERALHYQTQAIIFHDSLAQKEKRDEVNRILLEKEQQETALLAQRNELQQQNIVELRRRNLLAVLFSAALLIIGILAVWLLNARARRRQVELKGQLYLIRLRPHFLYNMLATLQHIALTEAPERSVETIGRLGQMFRSFFNVSAQEFISLGREREVLEEYIAVQRLRFTFPFEFRFSVEPGLPEEKTEIPPMLLQPFVENALEHANLEAAPQPCICVHIQRAGNKRLRVEISDNGQGAAPEKLAVSSRSARKLSSGIGITVRRIALLKGGSAPDFRVSTFDATQPRFPGTKIQFLIPCRRCS